jgi:hypothetical protein
LGERIGKNEVFLARHDDMRRQLLAYKMSTGIVSDYIKRYLDSDGPKSWAILKDNFTSRFSPMVDRP